MSRYSDIDPQDLDPTTGRPYSNYSSPSLDTSFHDGEMDEDEEGPAAIITDALVLLDCIESAETYDGGTAGCFTLSDGRVFEFTAKPHPNA